MKTTDIKIDSNISTIYKGYPCFTRVPLVVRMFFASLVTISCSLSTLYAVTVPSMPSNRGLVGYWRFDEGRTDKTRDYSGNGNIGTLTNFADPATATSGWVTSGKVGGAVVFDGIDDAISVPYSSLLAPTSAISFGGWFNVSSKTGSRRILSKTETGGYNLALNDSATVANTLSGTVNIGGAYYYVNYSLNNITTGTWYHAFVTHDGSLLSLYINGTRVATTSAVGSISYSGTNSLCIGGEVTADCSTDYLQGNLDEIRIYNRALSASEVAALAKNPAVSKPVSTAGSNLSSGLVGHWTFNGKDVSWGGTTGTTTIRDISGNGYHGGIYGIKSSALSAGKEGQTLTFGGFNNKGVYLGSDPALNPSVFTISGWVRTSSSTYIYNYIYSNSRDCCGTPYYGIDLFISSNGRLTGSIWDGAAKSTLQSASSVITANVWTYVTFSFDGTKMRFYKNGELILTSATTTNGVGSPASFASYLGSMGTSNGSQYTLGGQLDDMRLYSRALSDADVRSLYRLSSGTTKTSVSPTSVASGGGLVGHWTFDGGKLTSTTATDSSGLGNNGSVVGSVPSPTIGKLGQALLFDSATTTGIISASNPASLQINSGTISAWIKTGNAGAGYRGILIKSVAYGIYLRDNIFGLYDPTAGLFRTTSVNLADNRWHHVVASFDSGVTGGVSLYIDGTLRATSTMTIVNQGSNVQIGIGQGGFTQVFGGAIDDPRIYNRILSASEVYNLYRTGTR